MNARQVGLRGWLERGWVQSASLILGTALAMLAYWLPPPLLVPNQFAPHLRSRNASMRWQYVLELDRPLAQFPSVFWEPRDTESLRATIFEQGLAKGKTVLEVGTGTGLIAICCLVAGAERVVATDVNPAAIENARYNAEQFDVNDRLVTRLVPMAHREAFTVVEPEEQFDLIISNPPWVDRPPRSIDEYALYDEGFVLLQSLVRDSSRHLRPSGRIYLAYGARQAVEEVIRLSEQSDLEFKVLDERRVEQLSDEFLPGMLIELRPRVVDPK